LLEGRAGWNAVFSNEKRELSVGCTEVQASGLHKKAVQRAAEKGSPPAFLFLQSSLLLCRPPVCLNVQLTGPSCSAACQPTPLCSSPACRKFVFHLATRHSSPPTLRLVLSQLNMHFSQTWKTWKFAMFKNFIHSQLLKPIFLSPNRCETQITKNDKTSK